MPLLVFLSVATTGVRGVPVWARQHQLIQLRAHLPQADATLNTLAKPDVPLPPENLPHHGLTEEEVQRAPHTPPAAVKRLLECVKAAQTKTGLKEVVVLSHNARFHQTLLEQEGVPKDWKWFCTLEAFRKVHPEVGRKYWPSERPYSLPKLEAHFGEEGMPGLFQKHLLPNMRKPDLLTSPFLLEKLDKPPASMRDVKGVGPSLTDKLCKMIFRTFTEGPRKYFPYRLVNPNTLQPALLLMVGRARCEMTIQPKRPTLMNSLAEAEKSLRLVGVHQDEVLVHLLASAVGVPPTELARTFFPTQPHAPHSFRPWKFTLDECKRLRKAFPHARTASELQAEYIYATPSRADVLQRVNACLRTPLSATSLLGMRGTG